jgi:hypothetical protein
MSTEKKKRHFFGASSFDVLQDIIINREDCRFLQTIRDRDVSKNLTKADVWNMITMYYNQVIASFHKLAKAFVLTTVCHILFVEERCKLLTVPGKLTKPV